MGLILIVIIIASFYMGCLYTELRILKKKKPVEIKLPKIQIPKIKERESKEHKAADDEGANPSFQ